MWPKPKAVVFDMEVIINDTSGVYKRLATELRDTHLIFVIADDERGQKKTLEEIRFPFDVCFGLNSVSDEELMTPLECINNYIIEHYNLTTIVGDDSFLQKIDGFLRATIWTKK